ncbi:MAG: peptidase S41, partial [Dysgonamonadaceae bacterium]|nr:peptidase S41 [Dysgonamonadaceae bacterium]
MKIKSAILLLLSVISVSSCLDIEEYENNPRGNFEVLWKIMDEHYCFFGYKDVDWNQVHSDYSQRITDDMNSESLFMLLDEMLQELKDGHVNISSAFNVGRYWKWFEDYPDNYRQDIIDNYLKSDYYIAGGFYYKVLEDNIGYVRYADFSSSFGESNPDYVIQKFGPCKGIILDVRNNGGGYLTNSDKLASRFFNEKTLVGYIRHKTGKG